jgi:hypothetical protein
MKTLIFAILLFASPLLSQVDTANFEFKASGSDGKYTMLTNKGVYLGKAAGKIVTPIQFMLASIDTANWLFIPIGSDGTYRLVENKAAFMGMDSGTVRAQIVTGIQSIGTATTSSGVCTLNTDWGIVTSDQLPGEGVNECFITVNNSLCKTTSAIVFSILLLDEGDRNPNTPVTCNISTISDGSFVLRAGKSGGNFSANIVFYYHLQN